MMNHFPSLPLFPLLHPYNLFASFSYLAIQVKEPLLFISESCLQVVNQILKETGFQKIQKDKRYPINLYAILQKKVHHEVPWV